MNPNVATEKWGSSLYYKGLLSAEYVSLSPSDFLLVLFIGSSWSESLAEKGRQ